MRSRRKREIRYLEALDVIRLHLAYWEFLSIEVVEMR